MINWTPKRLDAFKSEIARARKQRKAVADTYGWDDNLERYVPLPKTDAAGRRTWDVNVGADFQDVERKKAALFYDTPTVSLVPDEPGAPVSAPAPPQPGQQPQPPVQMGTVVQLHQRLVNGLLAHRYADAKAVVQRVLFDVLCPAGVGIVKVGYDVATMDVEQPVTDPLSGQPLPVTQTVPVPIHEDWYLARISPYAYLVPADHRDTDVRLAPWVGYDFAIPVSEARRRFKLPDDWKPEGGGEGEDRPYFRDDELKTASDDAEPMVTGCFIEYHPAQLAEPGDPPVHPLQIHELVLIDGERQPVRHEPSPHQTIGDDARLTPDSITGYTIRPLTLRDRTDQAYVPSDCTVTAPLTKELNRYRTITVKLRDANVPITLYDSELLPADAKDKIDHAEPGARIPLVGGALSQGIDKVAGQLTQVSQNRENWTGQDYIERDRERILGIGGNQVGAQNKTNRTATEVQTVQRNTEARFEQERQRVLAWYVDLVCLFDAMVLRYADVRTAAKILGPQAAQVWAQHKGALAGAYAYEIQIDSGKYIDVEANKRQWLQLLNMIGQSPHVNAVPVLKKLAQAFGLDPAQVVIDQPPQRKPELKTSLAVSAQDLNPSMPQFPLVLEALAQAGYQFSPDAVNAAKAQAQLQATVQAAVANTAETPVPQPGTEPPQIQETLPKMPTLNQHQSDESGDRSGPKLM